MEWQVEYTDEFDAWWAELSEDEQIVIAAKVAPAEVPNRSSLLSRLPRC